MGERQPDDHRLPLDVAVGHEDHRPPRPAQAEPAVQAVVAVVTHDEDRAGRYPDGLAGRRLAGAELVVEEDVVLLPSESLLPEVGMLQPPGAVLRPVPHLHVAIRQLGRDHVPVEVHAVVLELDDVTRDADHPLDVVLPGDGVLEDDDVSSRRGADDDEGHHVRPRDVHAVDELVDEDLIPNLERGEHRPAGDAERLDEDRPDEQRHRQGLDDADAHPHRVLLPERRDQPGGLVAQGVDLLVQGGGVPGRHRGVHPGRVIHQALADRGVVHRVEPVRQLAGELPGVVPEPAERAPLPVHRAPDQDPHEPGHHEQPEPLHDRERRRTRSRGRTR